MENFIEKYSKWFPYCEKDKLKEEMRQDLSVIVTTTNENSSLHLDVVNCYALLDEMKQYRKEQAELFEWTKKNGHPKMASFDEGGLNACDKIIAIIERVMADSSNESSGLNIADVTSSFVPPDNEDVCWQKGADSFSRKEVAHIVWTQRAMIGNDLKAFCGKDMTKKMFEILNRPRTPDF